MTLELSLLPQRDFDAVPYAPNKPARLILEENGWVEEPTALGGSQLVNAARTHAIPLDHGVPLIGYMYELPPTQEEASSFNF